jgi:hypothetical protein
MYGALRIVDMPDIETRLPPEEWMLDAARCRDVTSSGSIHRKTSNETPELRSLCHSHLYSENTLLFAR